MQDHLVTLSLYFAQEIPDLLGQSVQGSTQGSTHELFNKAGVEA
jgi:hypothetical protein